MRENDLWKNLWQHGAGSTLIQAPARSGKTSFIVDRAAEFLNSGKDPERLLVLAPTRTAGDRLRSGINRSTTATIASPPVRTWSAYAFHLISRAFEAGVTGFRNISPKLLTGADQDQIIATLLSAKDVQQWPWPDDLGQGLGTRGFRKEVREFFDRLHEYRLTEKSLLQVIDRTENTPAVWPLLGRLFTVYDRVVRLDDVSRFDPAGLLGTAIEILSQGIKAEPKEGFEDFLSQERHRFDLILIDDFQEANPAMHTLLELVADESEVIAVANADTVVQGFRGAKPELLSNASEDGFAFKNRHTVQHSVELTGQIAATYQRATEHIGVICDSKDARLAHIAGGDGTTEVALTKTEAEQDLLILYNVLNWLKGSADGQVKPVPLHEQAVIVRNSVQVKRIADFLRAEGLPVRTNLADVVLADETAVVELLNLLEVAIRISGTNQRTEQNTETHPLDFEVLSAPLIESLLQGGYIGMTNLQVRSMRKQLLKNARPQTEETPNIEEELERISAETGFAGPGRERLLTLTTAALKSELEGRELSAADGIPEHLLEMYGSWGIFAPLRRLVHVLAVTVRSLKDPEQRAEDTLWELWDSTKIASEWKKRSAKPGAEGLQANRDLDAVVTLFQVAKRFQDQNLVATAQQFVEYVRALELPTDSLSKAGKDQDALAIMTAASSAGLSFSHVIVAGLQQGTWPNDLPRGSVLGSVELTEVMEGQVHTGPEAHLARRHAVRNDELRSFATAVSRARNHLLGMAVAAEDQQPSSFLQFLLHGDTGLPDPEDVPLSPTPHQIVAELRRELRIEAVNGNDKALTEPIELLSFLTQQPYPELAPAEPRNWWGVSDRSSDEPIYRTGEAFRLSPSRVETLNANPLEWLLDAIGMATSSTDFDLYRHVGTLIHHLAEKYPNGPKEVLQNELENLLPKLNLTGFFGQIMGQRINDMVECLAIYLAQARPVAGVEVPFKHEFETEFGPGLVSGVIDRLEISDKDRIRIVDFKTGKSVISAASAKENLQLALYQLAYLGGSVNVTERPEKIHEAALIFVGAGKNSVSTMTRSQPELAEIPIDPEAALLLAAAIVHQAHFVAVQKNDFGRDKLDGFSPVNNSGNQVTQA